MYHPNVQQFSKAAAMSQSAARPDKGNDISTPGNVRDNIVIVIDDGEDASRQAGSDPAELQNTASPTLGMGLGNAVPFGTRMTKGRRGRARGISNGLPQTAANPSMHYNFRYIARGDGATSVRIADLAKAMVAASTADSYRYLFRTVKVDRVTIRAATGAIGGTAAVKLQFLGSNTNEIVHMDQTMRVDHNACISMKPPRLSLASFWHDVTSTTDDEVALFRVSASTDESGVSYIDVSLSVVYDEARYINYTIQDSNLSGLNAGGLYYGKLGDDNQQLQWTPVARSALGV